MLMDRFRLDGKVALVTGSGRGIGRGCALAFAEQGAHIVCSARTQEQIDDTAAEARKHGVEALAQTCDVSDPAQMDALVDAGLAEASALGIEGAEVTPFLLSSLIKAEDSDPLAANVALLVSNASLAAGIAVATVLAASATCAKIVSA